MAGKADRTDLAYHIRSVDYVKSAHAIWQAQETLALRSADPLYLLIAHGLELTLKSHLLRLGHAIPAVEKFGHDLRSLFDEVCRNIPGSAADLAKIVRRRWIETLKEERDKRLEKARSLGLEGQASHIGLEIWSNDEIGRFAPEARPALEWLSARHSSGGSVFRYFESRIEQHTVVRLDGDNVIATPLTLIWLTEALQDCFLGGQESS
ncbi:hypothetical protein SAMN05216376_10730 [Mameliella alba]|uniref:hypothetical protein n=1 Tax=Mameliella alba TaxID=561184 RepID=UPI00088425A6|nr:hypothetical protein [Mameliella alba]OWV48581.1 hypothetical protein CDZ96_08175 [Mameliella alba]PTR39131.1 hypothetical protein LX94_02307 [Mameliella alba]GGF63469.1 hypothetical protein GCM10011319_25570 [Mameliella alba]SDD23806.1 hypothetical protein SAMN05216376_10730 [Mameliella alba]